MHGGRWHHIALQWFQCAETERHAGCTCIFSTVLEGGREVVARHLLTVPFYVSLHCRLFYKLFLAVNIEAKTVSRYMQAVGPAAVATAGSVDQIRGLECIWNLAVLSPNAVISTRCASVLCDLYSCLVPQEQVRY